MPYFSTIDPIGLTDLLEHRVGIPAEDRERITLLEHQMLMECARLEVEQARIRELAGIREALETIGVRQELLLEIRKERRG